MESKIKDIQHLLCEKSNTKQQAFQVTLNTFATLKKVMKEVADDLFPCLAEDAPRVEIKYTEKGDFEAHLKFSGDTLVVMMHTNIFDFDESHYVLKNPYIKEDPMREFCGLIQVYNFLADSIKYNREQDIGYLIGRIFVNKEKHFFIDGKRPLSFLYSDIAKNQITEEVLRNIIEEAMLFCLNFDLLAPPLDAISYICVEQKYLMSHSSGMPTGKRLGFMMSSEPED
jgi:hypothetical protein